VDRQTGGQVDRETGRCADGSQEVGQTFRQADRQTYIQKRRQADGQADRQEERQTKQIRLNGRLTDRRIE